MTSQSALSIKRALKILCEAALFATRAKADRTTRISLFASRLAVLIAGHHAELDALLYRVLATDDGKTPPAPLLIYPAEINNELTAILGKVPVETVSIAKLYRAAGHAISSTVTAQHSFVIDRMVRLNLLHGSAWRDVFANELNEMRQIANERAEEATPC